MSSGRLSGRVEQPQASLQLGSPKSGDSARESLGSHNAATTRVTASSVRRLQQQLTAVDRGVIDTLRIVRVATGAQLRQLHWSDNDTGKRLARHHLAKLTKLRLIARLERRIGGVRAGSDGFTYALDVAGQRLAAEIQRHRPRRPTTPGDRYMAHALAITDRYVDLRELEAAGHAELLGFEAEPDSWRRYPGPDHRPLTIKPDAFVILARGDWEYRWFLEIDRATEHQPTIARKAHAYVSFWQSGVEQHDTGTSPQVLWIAPSYTRAKQLDEWLRSLGSPAGELFDVCSDASFVSSISSAINRGEVST